MFFDNIISLGYNCEVSYRINDFAHKPIDAYPFSWAYTLDPSLFAKCLWHLDDLLKGDIEILSWKRLMDNISLRMVQSIKKWPRK